MRDCRDQIFKSLPIYVLWGIWLSRNKALFQGDPFNIYITSHKIRLAFVEQMKRPKAKKKNRNIPRMRDLEDRPWGYFDGASQDGNSEEGMINFLSTRHYFHFELGVGAGKNNEAELLALWGILKLDRLRNISSFRVFRDSTVIIDWFNKISNL